MKHHYSSRLTSLALALATGCSLASCTPTGLGDEAASRHVGVTVDNRLVYNRLVYNRLDATHLLLDSQGDDSIETTAEGRELLTYIARCALADGDVLVADHDGQTYEFEGLLGLAPEWEYQAISTSKQQLISACLLAHVNAFGVSVQISLRSDGYITSTASERADFPVHEATFFGQVFGDGALTTYACQGDEGPIAQAHSASRALRVCSDPDSPCGIVALGRCRDVCEEQVLYNGWRGCYGGGQRFDETISTYLFADDPDGQNQVCGVNENCTLAALPGTRAILDCSLADNCSGQCGTDGTCTIEGSRGNNIDAVVTPGAVAEADCLDTNNCNLYCDDASCELACTGANNCKADCKLGADCQIDCRGAQNCNDVKCNSGASCLLLCDPGANCWINACWHPDGVTTCPDGSEVCGRPCP